MINFGMQGRQLMILKFYLPFKTKLEYEDFSSYKKTTHDFFGNERG